MTDGPNMRSPLAAQVAGVRDPQRGRSRKASGFLLHTTGGGITDKARRTGTSPLQVAIEEYIAMQNGSEGYLWGGPGYVIDHDGSIHQVAPDDVMTAHAGGDHRAQYFDGSWTARCSPATVERWRAKWGPKYFHPYQLFPSPSPNIDYIGCEMIPVGDGFGGDPMAPLLRFTKAQHDAAVALARDVGQRNGFPPDWTSSSRLLGHEDVDPLNRSDPFGGWDPGFLRAAPYFDFAYVRSELER